MFIRYKKTHEKIAMGLLSYMPEGHCVKTLQEKIHSYETDDELALYLWKEKDDFVGLLGIHRSKGAYTVIDLAVNPSFRGEGIGTEMMAQLKSRYPDEKCLSTDVTQSFIEKCKEEA